MKSYYFVFVAGDVEPVMHGPYKTEEKRLKVAQKFAEKEGEGNGYFWIDNIDGVLEMGAFAHNAIFNTEEV